MSLVKDNVMADNGGCWIERKTERGRELLFRARG